MTCCLSCGYKVPSDAHANLNMTTEALSPRISHALLDICPGWTGPAPKKKRKYHHPLQAFQAWVEILLVLRVVCKSISSAHVASSNRAMMTVFSASHADNLVILKTEPLGNLFLAIWAVADSAVDLTACTSLKECFYSLVAGTVVEHDPQGIQTRNDRNIYEKAISGTRKISGSPV